MIRYNEVYCNRHCRQGTVGEGLQVGRGRRREDVVEEVRGAWGDAVVLGGIGGKVGQEGRADKCRQRHLVDSRKEWYVG